MVEAIIAPKRPLDLDFIIGMSGTVALGGVTVDGEGRVQFGLGNPTICASADTRIHIDKKDFSATYDPVTHVWTVAWKWSNGLAPGQLCNTREEYTPAVGIRKPYKEELNRWIHNGWLVPYNEEELGPAKALIPLLAVTQRSKGKVRPVLDFRELNTHIAAFTGNSDVCAHKLREWRRQGENVSILDLKQAYLQIHVDKSLWPYQTVIIDGRRHCLTRLGFGLNVAPIIMTAVVNCVLSRDADIQRATSAYIDDIFVNENVVEANRVKQHLADYGLAGQQNARWTYVDKRNQSQCVAGAVDAQDGIFLLREANSVTSKWDEPIDDDRIREQLNEVANAVKNQDPARGHWEVSGDKAKLWVDASTLAIGVMLEVNGVIVEDAAWLRPEDACHINMAELDAAIREVIEQLETIFYERGAPEEILTDNDTVFRSQTFADFLNRWGVRIKFRCAYVPSGNGIVERCHRTIKVIVARKKCSVREAVYLYNITPRDDRTAATAPANVIYRYLVRVRDVDPVTSTNQDISNRYNVGDEVWIRPLAGRCDTRYEEGTVTNVLSDQAVEIDGIPRHVRDIRRRAPSPDRQEGTNKTENEAEEPLLIRVPIRGSNVNAEPPAHLYESGEHLEQTHSADQGTELPAPQLRRSKRIRQQRGCSVCD
ncbi:integrase core domain protein [Trichuris suis]|nr:integrase core domain protein [Trichuris suis]